MNLAESDASVDHNKGSAIRARLVSAESLGRVAEQGHASELQFWLGSRPLSVSPWRTAAAPIIAPAIAKWILNLSRGCRVILAPHSGPDYRRSIGNRRLWVTAQEACYLEYVARRRATDFAWNLYERDGYATGALLVEVPARSLAPFLRRYFRMHSLDGFILPADRPSLGFLASEVVGQWERGQSEIDPSGLSQSVVAHFTDWGDGAGIRLWSRTWTTDDIAQNTDLELIGNLARVRRLPALDEIESDRKQKGARK